MKRATDRPMHHVWFAQSSSPASHCLVFAFALITSSTLGEEPLRSCTLDTQIMHFGHTSCFLFRLRGFLSSPLPASTFATSSAQIENKFKDKEELEQWLTAFGRHQVKTLCVRAPRNHRLYTLDTRAVSCLPFVTHSVAWFLSSLLPASTFATSSSRIYNKFNEKEELEQWLTAFGCRDQESAVDQF